MLNLSEQEIKDATYNARIAFQKSFKAIVLASDLLQGTRNIPVDLVSNHVSYVRKILLDNGVDGLVELVYQIADLLGVDAKEITGEDNAND
jgi:hypothetical protein